MNEFEDRADAPVEEILAVIVNFRTPDLVVQCLESLAAEVGESGVLRACVVDNSSGDGSFQAIRDGVCARGWSSWVEVTEAGGNLGFSGGNNVGIRSRPARYYWLINSDAYIRAGCLAEVLRAMESTPKAGLVGCRLEWPDGRAQESAFRFRTPITELVKAAGSGPISRLFPNHCVAYPLPDQPLAADWVSFACVLIRGCVLAEIGGLDEHYFLYFEDMDFCWRAKQRGWSTVYWPAARAVHLRGQSGDVKQASSARRRRPRFYYASRSRVLARMWGRKGLWAANALWLVGRIISWTREVIGGRPRHTCEREALDIWTRAWSPLACDPLDPRRVVGAGREMASPADVAERGAANSRTQI